MGLFHAARGLALPVAAEGILLVFDGAAWAELAPQISAKDLQDLDGVGINASSDGVNRLVVSAAASLFNNEGAGHQVKVNKNAVGDTARLLFQTGWSGRAEMGLAGNDDFSVKVSADGSAWLTGLAVDAASGAVDAPSGLTVEGQPVWHVGNFMPPVVSAAFELGVHTVNTAPSGGRRRRRDDLHCR